jgi:hypothetical protein
MIVGLKSQTLQIYPTLWTQYKGNLSQFFCAYHLNTVLDLIDQ